MNIKLTHLKLIMDALVTSRLAVMRKHQPIGVSQARLHLTPAVQHRLNEMQRIIEEMESHIVDSTTDDTWTLEKN